MQRKHVLVLGVLVAAVSVLLVPATGQAGGVPVLSWSPSGTYDLGSSGSSHSFTLTNSGGSATSALVVTLGGANPSQFSISHNTCSGTSLGPKKHCSLTVTYTEAASGKSDMATLTAMSKKPANASVTLTGNTRLSPTLSLTFSPDPAYTGDTVSAQATLHDATATAGGTATYLFYSTGNCSALVSTQTVNVTNGSIPASSTQPPAQAGSWSWKATYSGDSGNNNATSPCVEMDVTSNLVPNPSFTDDCSGIPCSWTSERNSTIARDTSTYHSSPASISITPPTTSEGGAVSGCFAVSPSTNYTLSAWYNTMSSALTNVVAVFFFDNSSCSGFYSTVFDDFDAIGTGEWRLLQEQATSDSLAQSAYVVVDATCGGNCPASQTVNFDDVSLTPTP